MFHDATVQVSGGNFTQVSNIKQYIGSDVHFERLLLEAAPNALYNSGERRDASTCHPNTRIAIRERIAQWVESLDTQTVDKLIMWLHGPAGAGKSAIAQTIADLFYEEGLLLAAFFFSRFDPTRNHSRSLISTIAYQVALSLPSLRGSITTAIEHDPHLFSKSLLTQITALLLEPLRPLVTSGYFNDRKSKRVIIIDGLDECKSRKEQLEILATIADVLQNQCIPLSFIIASRPEHELKTAFRAGHLKELSIHLPLNDDLQANADIERFLRDRFDAIKFTHPFKDQIPSAWPVDEVIARLVRKSSGQFIYASTVIKFVESRRRQPALQLDIILGLRSRDDAQPFEELDALYRHIFSSVENPELALQILSIFLLPPQIIRVRQCSGALTPFYPELIRLSTYETLLDLNPGDATIALCDLGSLVEILGNPDRRLRFFHASLDDFLFDESRSGIFYLDTAMRHAEIAHHYFQRFLKKSWNRDLAWFAWHLRYASPTSTLLRDINSVSFGQLWNCCQQEGRRNAC